MSKAIFLSHFLSESTPGYGGKPGFFKQDVSRISDGATSNSQEWKVFNHIGTHIDLPAHFDDSGKRMQDYAAEDWIFQRPFLLHYAASANQIISFGPVFEQIPMDCDFLILKTDFQKHREDELYWSNNPGLSPELALWLRQQRPQLKMLGFDFISITSFPNRPLGRTAHRQFLGASAPGLPLRVIEDMKLDSIDRSPATVVVLPWMVWGADGAPVTVLALF